MPAISPPPEAPTTATSGFTPSLSRSSQISRPAVPCPAMTSGSSNGGTSTAPRFCAMSRAIAARSSLSRSYSTTSAPSAAVRSRLAFGASDGITITAGMPQSAAACATPWA